MRREILCFPDAWLAHVMCKCNILFNRACTINAYLPSRSLQLTICGYDVRRRWTCSESPAFAASSSWHSTSALPDGGSVKLITLGLNHNHQSQHWYVHGNFSCSGTLCCSLTSINNHPLEIIWGSAFNMGSIAHIHFTALFQIPLQTLLKFQWEIVANFLKIYNQCKEVCKQL